MGFSGSGTAAARRAGGRILFHRGAV